MKMIKCFLRTCALKDKLSKSVAKKYCLMNLGPLISLRYFSSYSSSSFTTSKNTNTISLSQKTILDISFKLDSRIYKSLHLYIKNNAINADTQKQIEKFLLRCSYFRYDNQSVKIAGIDFSKINP